MKNEKTTETRITTQEYLDTSLAKFNPIESKIKKLEEDYLPMEIAGVNDIEGYNAVDIARKDVKKYRTTVEGIRKQEVADALKFQKSVNTEAKRITEMLTPIEEHLIAEQRKIQKQKEEIEAEKKRLHALKIQDRIKGLIGFGMVFTGVSYIYLDIEVLPFEIDTWTDDEFEAKLLGIKATYEAEQERIAEVERQRKEEELAHQKELQEEVERLAKIAQEQERQRKQFEAQEAEMARRDAEIKSKEQAILRAERAAEAKKQAEETERLRKIEFEKAEKERIEREKVEAEQHKIESEMAEKERIRLEKEEANFKVEQLKIEAAKIEAMKPDKEKLRTFAEFISKIKTPNVTSPEAEDVILNVITAKTRMEDYIMKFVNG
jgi:hypothetical protein